jgi:Flp pilus assembly protein TadG
MKNGFLKIFQKPRLWARQEGSISVEFVILFPLLALTVVALMEFGYLWFVRHTLTNASREGARAAVVFYTGGDRATWAQNTAKSTVDGYLQNIRFPGTWNVVTAPGTGTGDVTTVKVTTPNGLMLLDKFLPSYRGVIVSGETTMKME